MSGRAIARLLLAAGALLVVIAAAAFTVANWSGIGPLGRCAVLLGVSAVMLFGPLPLTRRGLAATAESVAAIGLALTVADAYLVVRLLHLHLQLHDRPFGIAALTVALTGLWAGYGRVSRLRGPWLAAIGLAQVPGLYVVDGLAREFGGPGVAVAGPLGLWLVVSAGADVLLGAQAHRRGRREAALTCSVFAVAAWIAGVVFALAVEVTGPDLAIAGWAAATLAVGAVVGAVLWPRNGLLAATVPLLAVLSGAALAGLGSPIAVALPAGWRVVAFAGVSAAVVAGARVLPDRAAARLAGDGVRLELVASGAAAILASAALYVGPSAARALAGPFPLQGGWAADPVQSAPLNVTAGSDAGFPTLIVLLLLGAVAWLAPVWHRSGRRHPVLMVVAVAAGAASIASLPVSLHVGGWTRLAVLTTGVAALAALAIPASERAAHPEAAHPEAGHPDETAPPETGRPGQTAPPPLAAFPPPLAFPQPLAVAARPPLAASRPLACTLAALILAVSALGWSLATAPTTVAELAALLLAFAVTSALAKDQTASLMLTATALASATGLAFAAPMAAGWSASQAAPVAVAVAAIAVALGTWLLQDRPAQGLVLDVGAVVTVLTAALVGASGNTLCGLPSAERTAGVCQPSVGSFALVVALGAMLAAGTAWLRDGRRRSAALIVTGVAGAAAVIAQSGPLAAAWFTPQAGPWHGQPLLGAVRRPRPAVRRRRPDHGPRRRDHRRRCMAGGPAVQSRRARGRAAYRRGSGGTREPLRVRTCLCEPAGPGGWPDRLGGVHRESCAGWRRDRRDAAHARLGLRRTGTHADRARQSYRRLRAVRVAGPGRAVGRRTACASLSVLGAAGFTATAVVAAGGSAWQAGLAVLGVAAAGLFAAAWLSGQFGLAARDESQPEPPAGQAQLAAAIELASAVVAVAGMAACLHRPLTASVALALVGALAIGSAARRDRRSALWAGLILLEIAWCMWLAALGVRTIEAYTIPAGAIAIAFGRRRAHQQRELSSWLAYGSGLAVLLGPSLGAAWQDQGWLRPALLGVAAAGVTLAGARLRLQAPLLLGIAVAALDAGRQLAPEVRALTQALPGWVPIALIGAILLWAGATYEARLRNLTRLRRVLSSLN